MKYDIVISPFPTCHSSHVLNNVSDTHTHTHKELHTYRWTLLFPLRQSLALAEAKSLKYHLEVSKQRVKTPKAAFSQKSGTEEPSACRYCGLRRVH